ncbi:MAG TPA: hypothetical protein DCL35_03455 [Candidatus Omnitrophica bacterium]|nr:hypothetical protein [Candidatus Omnitrophota bacterium]
MMDQFIYFLTNLFTVSIAVWALSAYAEIWFSRSMVALQISIAEILKPESGKEPIKTFSDDYFIINGSYKGRNVVCRFNRLSSPLPFHYNLSGHCYIAPLCKPKAQPSGTMILTSNTRLQEDHKIYYNATSVTSLKLFFLSKTLSRDDMLGIFEELTHAAEIVEEDAA